MSTRDSLVDVGLTAVNAQTEMVLTLPLSAHTTHTFIVTHMVKVTHTCMHARTHTHTHTYGHTHTGTHRHTHTSQSSGVKGYGMAPVIDTRSTPTGYLTSNIQL